MTFCLREFHILHLIFTEGGAKLFVGMTRNDVTVNVKGGATCIDS